MPADHRERWPQGAKLVDGNADRIAAVGGHIGQPAWLERADSIALADQTRRIDGVTGMAVATSIYVLRLNERLSIPISKEAFPCIIR